MKNRIWVTVSHVFDKTLIYVEHIRLAVYSPTTLIKGDTPEEINTTARKLNHVKKESRAFFIKTSHRKRH